MRFLQLNLNHCEVAQDLLWQTLRERKIDVAILCEPYMNVGSPNNWIVDVTGKAVVWVNENFHIQEIPTTQQVGFTWVKVEGIYICSVYAPPSASMDEFEQLLYAIVDTFREQHAVIIAGDFNAWATDWGSRTNNRRGDMLLESFSALDIAILNNGTSPTFVRNGNYSVIDVTFVGDGLVPRVSSWQVSDHYTHSDHMAILFDIASKEKRPKVPAAIWNSRSFDRDSFTVMMEGDTRLTGNPSDKVDQLMGLVIKASDVSMSRNAGRSRHPPVYWWNDEIAERRKKCIRSRRRAQRARGRPSWNVLKQQHAAAKRELVHAIKVSKRRGWKELCSEVDEDPWGRPYKTVMSKLKSNSRAPPTCPVLLDKIVTTLFPPQRDTPIPTGNPIGDVVPISMAELRNASRKVGETKAPGPDGIPNIALKTAIELRPELFLEVYNDCLREGVFPGRWKQQRLVLLPKGKKPPNEPSSYRPICLLDTAGKVLERILCNRLEDYTEGPCGLSDKQFGFRKSRSTIDAIEMVIKIAREAVAGERWQGGTKQYCAIVTLDVRNAFNSARWSCILDELQKFGVPEYLKRIIGNYFSNRVLLYDTSEGPKTRVITGGVPQGSVLGPLLWNFMYDAVLRLGMPPGVTVVGFADDVAVVVVEKFLDDITYTANKAVHTIRKWLASVGLQLADNKTEVVLVTSRKVRETITLTVGEHDITSLPSLRYLGIQIDARLRFDEHLENISEKAGGVANSLSRIMPNVGGPRQQRRKLLMSVVSSVLLYAAPIWAQAMEVKSYARSVIRVYRRSVLRVARAFRTVSYEAACVVAGMVPIELLVDERTRLYRKRKTGENGGNQSLREEEHVKTLATWQLRWNTADKGRWTQRLIPDIASWMERHGEVDHYLCQLLTGHGCFRAYQQRFGLDTSSLCPACAVIEDAEHVFFQCPRLRVNREKMQDLLGEPATPENIGQLMLSSEANWNAVADFAATTIKFLRIVEEERRLLPAVE